jgi:excisionase family DNA binding protein
MVKEYLTLDEAAELMRISRATLWRRMREDGIQTYQSVQDRRIRLVRHADIEEMMKPRPIVHTPAGLEGKAAA